MTRDDTTESRHTRRDVVAGATAAAATLASAGVATAQEERPAFGGWLDGVAGGYRDARGEDTVTVQVGASGNGGAFAFRPAGLWIDPGTTVRWEWTGEGGSHNVQAGSGPDSLDSGSPVSESGVHYEHTFEEGGITEYVCVPHETLGMKGAVAVGDEVPLASAGGDGGGTVSLPGGPFGTVFLAVLLGSVGTAALAALAGEFYGSIERRAGDDGHTSAHLTAAVAAIVGLLLVAAVAVNLVLA